MTIALRLAKAQWWQGDPGKVLNAPSDQVMAAVRYENFIPEYERAMVELNKERR